MNCHSLITREQRAMRLFLDDCCEIGQHATSGSLSVNCWLQTIPLVEPRESGARVSLRFGDLSLIETSADKEHATSIEAYLIVQSQKAGWSHSENTQSESGFR